MTAKAKRKVATIGMLGAAGAMIFLAVGVSQGKTRTTSKPSGETFSGLQAVASKKCSPSKGHKAKAGKRIAGNPRARRAAQRGLDFLAKATVAWQKRHRCYGCHVQAVTLEGMAVGKKNQYRVLMQDFKAVIAGVTTIVGGSRTRGGLQYRGGSLLAPSKAFGGAAIARYDSAIDGALRDDLLSTAKQLLKFQQKDGRFNMQYTNAPVAVGDVQGTYLAVRTWKQAYERSADDRWLTAVQKAEKHLQQRGKTLLKSKSADVQQLNYALMGLLEAGTGASEELPTALRRRLITLQREDGSWAVGGRSSLAYGTGQALYALRAAGMTDHDSPVRRGMRWLITKQKKNGAWSHSGSEKAEAMWAVLGLVSLDVVTVAISALQDGQHVSPGQRLRARGTDNKGGSVTKMELMVDDMLVASTCGGKLSYTFGAGLGSGKHVAVISATNSKGQKSRRRVEFYTGNVYLTQVGTRYTNDGKTEISARNIAPDAMKNRVRLSVYTVGKDGKVKKKLKSLAIAGKQGPTRLAWDGRTKAGKKVKSGRYIARLEVVNKAGKVVQTKDTPFAHATRAEQRRNYAEVEGRLDMGGGKRAENAQVDLVDDRGNVVASTRSTKSGQYRFRNVPRGKYKLQLRKAGFAAQAAPVAAEPARKPSVVNIQVRKK